MDGSAEKKRAQMYFIRSSAKLTKKIMAEDAELASNSASFPKRAREFSNKEKNVFLFCVFSLLFVFFLERAAAAVSFNSVLNI